MVYGVVSPRGRGPRSILLLWAAAASAGLAQAPQAAPAGTIRGTALAGAIPLPGVAITATNTLTGSRYRTATDIDGKFAMAIPKAGRYVVKAELAAFAPASVEVRLTADATTQTASFSLQLASRAAAAGAGTDAATQALQGIASALGRGTQALSVNGSGSGALDASAGESAQGASLPSLGGLGEAGAADTVAVSGQVGQTNGLAGFSEDQIRQRIEDAVAQARQQGGATGDQANAVVSMLGGLMGGPGPGSGVGSGGGGRRGGGGGGFGGSFRNFNPTQPHGNLFYQGGFSALDAQSFSLTGTPSPKPASYQNRFGASFAGSPSIPGLLKASTKQFVFLNVTGARNINPLNLYATVPTLAQRGLVRQADGSLGNGDANLSTLSQTVNGVAITPAIYDPGAPGMRFQNNIIPMGRISAQARALLGFYPLPNVAGDPTTRNYQTVTTQGQNTTNASARYVRNFGAGGGFGPFGGGGRRNGQSAPAGLRQNLNAAFSYSHAAQDIRNVFLPLGGKSSSDGYGLSAGYTIGFGRLTDNASLNWNRSHALTTNYFTGAAIDPAQAAGISVPSQGAQLARAGFYNGVPNIGLTSFTSLTEQTPREAINQTISLSDFVAYGYKKHNLRFGFDLRRVHQDSVGGNNVVGTFNFSGYLTESPADQALTTTNSTASTQQATTGAALADFLLGQPQQTRIQAGLFKTYLRENVLDAYAQDDFRVTSGLSLNYGLRWEYFSPFVEKYNRLVNLDHNADFTAVDAVQPNGTGSYLGRYPRSLVNPDRTMFAPRVGVAWRPAFLRQTVVRGGYGVNFNTGQFATFAQSLAFQPPFAVTQNNTLTTQLNPNGCTLTTMTLASGFNCSGKAIENNYSVDRDYRLGRVQVYNLDLQRSLPHNIVLNVGYNGSRGTDLDIVRAPNHTATSVTTANAQAFTYEDSVAESRNNQLTVSARKRMERGIALQVAYQYGHSIDNASSIGGGSVSQVQNDRRLDLEEGNSSFDVRHKLTGNFVFELPFGPNRAFLSKGGLASKLLDGFTLSGDYTFASGTYYTPQYVGTAAQLAAGGTYTLRPDRVFSQPIAGPGSKQLWFNKAAFLAPQDTATGFGTASRNSIEGPGIVGVDMSFGRTVELGGTRSLEARMAASNVFNTVQYSAIDTTVNSATFGQVTAAAQMRRITVLARYRF